MKAQGDQTVALTALAMVTSLGRDAITSCAAARAGLTRPIELAVLDFHAEAMFGREVLEGPPKIYGHTVRGVADGFTGLGKAMLLGGAAFDDLLSQRTLSEQELASTGFVLNLSDHHVIDAAARTDPDYDPDQPLPSVAWQLQTARLLARLAEAKGMQASPEHHILRHGGRVGVAAAVLDAVAMVTRGDVDRCIVGAIDSLTEPAFLRAAAAHRLLRTNDNPEGLIPGEAGVLFLLERQRDAVRAGVPILATLGTTVVEQNDVDVLTAEQPPTGQGLASLLAPLLESSPPIDFSIGDLNGTAHRGKEWGGALVRLRATHNFADLPAWFPALSFGDTGAAAGAIGVCVAARAFVRRYAPGSGALVWLSSEAGAKAAIMLRAAAG